MPVATRGPLVGRHDEFVVFGAVHDPHLRALRIHRPSRVDNTRLRLSAECLLVAEALASSCSQRQRTDRTRPSPLSRPCPRPPRRGDDRLGGQSNTRVRSRERGCSTGLVAPAPTGGESRPPVLLHDPPSRPIGDHRRPSGCCRIAQVVSVATLNTGKVAPDRDAVVARRACDAHRPRRAQPRSASTRCSTSPRRRRLSRLPRIDAEDPVADRMTSAEPPRSSRRPIRGRGGRRTRRLLASMTAWSCWSAPRSRRGRRRTRGLSMLRGARVGDITRPQLHLRAARARSEYAECVGLVFARSVDRNGRRPIAVGGWLRGRW
jgi:hypothetical protein